MISHSIIRVWLVLCYYYLLQLREFRGTSWIRTNDYTALQTVAFDHSAMVPAIYHICTISHGAPSLTIIVYQFDLASLVALIPYLHF